MRAPACDRPASAKYPSASVGATPCGCPMPSGSKWTSSLGRHRGLPLPGRRTLGFDLGVFFIERPGRRVVCNVPPDSIQRFVTANNMFVVVALPKTTMEHRPSLLFDPIGISFCRQRLEPVYNIRQRHRTRAGARLSHTARIPVALWRGNPLWLPYSVVSWMDAVIRAGTGACPYQAADRPDGGMDVIGHDHKPIGFHGGVVAG
jgi:hypothetical protein